MILGISLLSLAGIVLLYQVLAAQMQPLPIYMTLPDASLLDQDDRPFDLNETRGKVVVFSPIYTSCPDICPLTTSQMKLLQKRIRAAGLSEQVQLVTFSVDPERDRPQVLKRFEEAYKADLSNWVFLTGSNNQVQILIKDLGLYVERVYNVQGTPVSEQMLPDPEPGTPYSVNHTDRIFLIDRQGRVRALQSGSRMDVDIVLKQIQQLVRMN
jgi:protein SCO1